MQGAFWEGLGRAGLEKDEFFSSGRQEDQETPVTLLQSLSPSTLLPKSMSGQRTSQLSLPSLWELPGRHKESHRQCWAPKLVSGPPSPGRGVCEENKENLRMIQTRSLRMIFTPVPLASQMTACCHPSWLQVFFGVGAHLSPAA